MAPDEPQLPGLGPITGGSAATMATGGMAGSGGAGEEERGPEGPPDNFRSSSLWFALLFIVGSLFSSAAPATNKKKRMAKKRDKPCAVCEATKTPLWRTWPTDRRVMLCNACGIRARTPRVLLPELVYLPHPATATATTVVSESEIQPVSGSPGAVPPEKIYVHYPVPPAAFKLIRTRKRRKGKEQQQAAQVCKKRKGNESASS